VLRSKTADQVRRALIATNERIRVGQRAGHEAVLFVYYSGHGDADALHLGETQLALRELEALVRGSSAQIRILVIDSCRSGSITRVKGGKPAPPLALSSGIDDIPGEGVIVLTASTAGEDAQESDEIAVRSSRTTSSRGFAAPPTRIPIRRSPSPRHSATRATRPSSLEPHPRRHPAPDVPLRSARPRRRHAGQPRHARTWTAHAPRRRDLARGTRQRERRREIVAGAKRRTLSLRPGRYVVRGRTREALLEGTATVAADRETLVDASSLSRTTYARLVRKGKGDILRYVSGPIVGPQIQTAIIDGASPCFGLLAGWTFVRSDLTLSPRVAACRGEFSNRTLDATTDVLALELRVAKAWDTSSLTLDLGITGGAELLHERFVTRGIAPTRSSAAAHVDAGAGISLPIARGYVGAELAAQTHFFSIEDQAGARQMTARFALRTLLLVGVWL